MPSHPECEYGHVCEKLSGLECIDCGEPAGTLWGVYWCPDCDEIRLNKIAAAFDEFLWGVETNDE